LFIAIAGVPTDLVDARAVEAARFDSGEPSRIDAFYDAILNDPRMQEEIDSDSLATAGQERLKPSCTRVSSDPRVSASAYPPRRIVELAKRFGSHGLVQSICQDDFVPALEPILTFVSFSSASTCFPHAFSCEDDRDLSPEGR
jgi:hypothetical protein